MDPWEGRRNAEIYDRFVEEHPIYRRLNRRIVELADLPGARAVLDLACGTGATARACLAAMDREAELTGVDASADMVAVARASVLDPRARFVVAAAAAVDRHLDGPFDRAVCNAAFWQFPATGAALRAVAAVLGPGARLVFNVPVEVVAGEDAPAHPFQAALTRALERRAGRPFEPAPERIDPRHLRAALREHGFGDVERRRLRHDGPQAELMDLMSLPTMIAQLAPGLSDDDRDAAVREARERSDPRHPVSVEWIYFTAVRR